MMMHHPIKFGCKRISRTVNTAETVIYDHKSPHCDFDPEDSESIFLQNTLAHDDVSSYQVWLKKIQQFWRYLDKRSLKFWTFVMTLKMAMLVS